MAHVVTTENALNEVCARLLQEPVVAIDTEFLWERTYYPVLGLLQVGVADGTAWLIDPLAVGDLSAFGPVLKNQKTVKILHDPLQDLQIICRVVHATPTNVFDTREGAGFAGRSGICSLKALIESLFNITLNKSETRSDWTHRPLTEEQLRYAADDVVYLPRAREALIAQCADDDVRRWMAESFARYNDPALYEEANVEDAAKRVKFVGSGLSPRQMNVVRALAIWRERVAREHDRPRNFIARDGVLADLARRPPRTIQAFSDVRGFPHRIETESIRAAMDAIAFGLAMPLETEAPRSDHASTHEKTDAALAAIATRAQARGVDPVLVASRREVATWVNMSESERATSRLMMGWRGELLAGCLPQ